VLAVDRDPAALEALRGVANVTARAADLEGGPWPFVNERFDAVVVANYLHRPLWPALLDAVAHDGVLLYETFAAGNEAYGRPRNPAFLLERDELADQVRGRLTVVAFEQGRVDPGGRLAVVQRIAAVGRGRAWPPALPSYGR
jgi:SAM-dependent methyltransferase